MTNTLSEPPTDLERCLAILVLRSADRTQDEVASIVRRSKGTVVNVERWFTDMPYSQAAKLCDDTAIKRVISVDLVPNEQVDKELLEKVLQITRDDLLRHYRGAEYLKTVYDPARLLEEHFHHVAQAARVLGDRIQRMLWYKEKRYEEKYEPYGNILTGMGFSMMSKTGALMVGFEEPKDNFGEVDPLLAECLFRHYEDKFCKLPFTDWEQITMANINHKLVDNLKLLAYGRLDYCPTCRICKQIAG